MTIRCKISQFLIAAATAAGAFSAPAVSAEVLRVCSDPDNLPFSKAEGPERGLYVELAELVGQRLNSPVEYVWWLSFNQRKALRNTILQDGCDAYFALPADAEYKVRGLEKTHAFLSVSYAVVAPPALGLKGLSDLKGKRIAVLIGSPPHILLARGLQQHEFSRPGRCA
jgi:ABC-type amino acid transport substrate-binding protein